MYEELIAHYRISGKIGEGAMGEVYRATDTKLNREVAVKVLPSSFADSGSELARFEREAQLLAALNHPNIATIHGIEDIGNTKAIVLELVEGETLQERLKCGPLTLEETLPIFRQIAEALEAAHEKGIIHRDLKPGNIKFTADGQIKVLDFGLAKAVEDANAPTKADAATLPLDATLPGSVLGTPAYMSPEQTRGQPVDRRTDVWAFGCCLYEALTGRKPFRAQTVSDMMAEVLKADPDFTLAPVETPEDILMLLRRCLEKEPRRRLRDIGDIAIHLDEASATINSRTGTPESPSTSRKSGAARIIGQAGWFVAILLAVGVGFAISRSFFPSTTGEFEPVRSVAVLPFDNLKQDEDLAWLSETMVADIHFKLKQGLKDGLVIRRGSVPLSKMIDGGKSRSDAADMLGVDLLVSGNYLQHDDVLRFDVTLIRGHDGQEEPLGNFDNAANDLLQVQGDVALAIAEKIRSNLSQEEKDRLSESDHFDLAAYELFRQGIHQYDSHSSDGFVASENLLRGALKIDPGYDEAAGHLAAVPWMQSIWGGSTVTPEEAVNQSWAIIQQYESNLRRPERLKLSKAWLSCYGDRNWKESERRFREFLEEMPQVQQGASSYASYLVHVEGRTREALRLVNLAIEEEPDRLNYLHNRAVFHWIAGDYAACIKDRDDILRSHPDHWHSILESSTCQAALGSFEDAEKRARNAVKASKENPVSLANLAKILALSGETDEALELYGQLKEKREEIYFDEGWLAETAYALGLKEDAFELLETAAAGKGRWSILALRSAFTIGLMGDESRYWELVDQLNFPTLPYSHPYYEKEQQMRFGKGEGGRQHE